MSAPRARPRRGRPVGREQVVEALLESATELLAERGPRAVSAREIARRARVNHGLVHRHFGSKDALVQAVLDRLTSSLRQELEPGAIATSDARRALLELLARDRRYLQVLARALLDGHVGWLERAEFPVIQSAAAALARAQERGEIDDAIDARVLAATYVALGLGWLVFEPFAVASSGLGARPSDALRARMLEGWERMATRLLTCGETAR